jgi:hypothetical protein
MEKVTSRDNYKLLLAVACFTDLLISFAADH